MAWIPGAGKWLANEGFRGVSSNGIDYISGDEIIDARNGRVVRTMPSSGVANDVISFTATAVYLESTGISPVDGLWKFDLASGKMTQVTKAPGEWSVADDTAAWGTVAGGTRVVRLDLATGAVKTVYKDPAPLLDQVQIAGFAGAGVLVISTNEAAYGVPEPRSVAVVYPDGSAVPVHVPSILEHATIAALLQDGPTVLLSAFYPLSWPEPPAGLHRYGLAAFDVYHGLRLLMANSPAEMIVLGPCMAA